MKKLALTIAVVFGIAIGAFAQEGGLFGLGRTRGDAQYNSNGYRDGNGLPLVLPEEHGKGNDYNATPVGSGIAVLIGFGAAYAMSKRRKK